MKALRNCLLVVGIMCCAHVQGAAVPVKTGVPSTSGLGAVLSELNDNLGKLSSSINPNAVPVKVTPAPVVSPVQNQSQTNAAQPSDQSDTDSDDTSDDSPVGVDTSRTGGAALGGGTSSRGGTARSSVSSSAATSPSLSSGGSSLASASSPSASSSTGATGAPSTATPTSTPAVASTTATPNPTAPVAVPAAAQQQQTAQAATTSPVSARTAQAASTTTAAQPEQQSTNQSTANAQEAEPSAPAIASEPITQSVSEQAPDENESVPEKPIGGIDTVNIEEGGNWLLKRKAVEDMIDLIGEINRRFSSILEARADYKIKQNQLDNEYDKFVTEIGFDIGDADKLLADLLEQLDREQKRQGDLTEQERELLAAITQKQNELTVLQEELQNIHAIESKINDVMTTVDSQIKISNGYQNKAWANFQEIKQLLSDEKAEELYYATDASYKSLQDIYAYLKNTLASYFNDQIQAMRDQMSKIKMSIANLQQIGLDLKHEFEKYEKQDLETDERRTQEEIDKEIREKAAQEAQGFEKKQASKGIFSSIFSSIIRSFTKFFSAIGNFLGGIWDKISSLWKKPMPAVMKAPAIIHEEPIAKEPESAPAVEAQAT
ncbi:hypothetical protein HYX58_01645 [Candidatus Dependentiae bacterium]|nr:hypothetical protein [Candidatus Dependentiae bacterium]